MECQGVFHLLEGGMNKQLKLEFIRVNPNISLPLRFHDTAVQNSVQL